MTALSRTFLLAALLPAISFGAGGASSPPRGRAAGCEGCSVIVISMTNVSAGRMSLHGYARKTTPRLEKWAEGAVVFDNAFAHSSWTLPESVSLLTSLYPYAHGVWTRALGNSLGAEVKTLPEVLRDAGYATAAFTGGLDYDPSLSQMRGFQFTANSPEDREELGKPRPAPGGNPAFTGFEATLAQSKRWLKTHSKNKFLLLVQGFDAHCPFLPPKEFKGRFSGTWEKSHGVDSSRCVRGDKDGKSGTYKAIYAGGCPISYAGGLPVYSSKSDCRADDSAEITLAPDDIDYLGALYDEALLQEDSRIADFLESLPPELLRRTIVVVTSDHGEMLGAHGRFGRPGAKRGTQYDDVLHVPLLMKIPAQAPRRVAGLAQHIDLMPTLLAAVGVNAPPGLQGKNLLPLVRAGTPVNEYVYSGVPYKIKNFPFTNVVETIRGPRWKLIHERLYDSDESGDAGRRAAADGFELYDVLNDREESKDLSGAEPEELSRMKARLNLWSRATMRLSVLAAKTDQKTEEILKSARERGYWQ
jgi:arylsulfatase A-like enzyme